jgi:hypothetical protein
MSALSEQGPTTPNDPLHYAPRRLRERETSLSSLIEANRDAARPSLPPTSLDASLENAVYQSLRRPLEPEIMPDPETFTRGGGRSKALYGAAAVGVSAIAALFFVYMVHASQEPDAASFAAAVQSMKTQPTPQGDAASGGALAEFRGLLAAPDANQPASHEESEKLLHQFVQWRQKAGATDASQ